MEIIPNYFLLFFQGQVASFASSNEIDDWEGDDD